MSIAEINGRAGYLAYVTGRTARKEGQKDFGEQIEMVFENPVTKGRSKIVSRDALGDAVTKAEREEGKFLGLTMVPEEGQLIVYGMAAKLLDCSTTNKPIVQISSNLGGKQEYYNVDISKIDPENASQIEMFALCCYADEMGLSSNPGTFGSYQKIKYYAENAQMNGYCGNLEGADNFFTVRLDWKEIVRKMMDEYLNVGIDRQYQDGVNLLELLNKF